MIKKLIGLFERIWQAKIPTYIYPIVIFSIVLSFLSLSFSHAENYTFYYGNGCSHCAKVEKFFEQNNIESQFQIEKKEVWSNKANREEFVGRFTKLGVGSDQQGVPLLLIFSGDEQPKYLVGDSDIISLFQNKIGIESQSTNIFARFYRNFCNWNIGKVSIGDGSNLDVNSKGFLIKLLPSALSDSINPCVFTIMLLLLLSILTKHNSRKKAILARILFALAVFVTYFTLGVLFAKGVASFSNNNTIFWIKVASGILGILVGLANLKDYFRYGKVFVMEVPFSRRPTMKKIIDKVSSPRGAFFVGIFVSMFIAPCSSGPYLPILTQIGSSKLIDQSRGITLLLIYNAIFILPMLVIVYLVGFGIKTPEELAKIKNRNTKRIHLIVGILMLLLGIYLTLEALCVL